MNYKNVWTPLRVLLLVGPAACLVLTARPAGAQQSSPCDCIDLADIKQKIREAEAAIQTYQSELGNLQRQKYTRQAKEALQQKVKKALDQTVKGRLPLQTVGGTDNLCQITVEGPTTCLKESTRRHEEIHRQACLKTRNLAKIVTGKDRFERDNASMADYVLEEINAYAAALDFLDDQLQRLQPKCSKKWKCKCTQATFPTAADCSRNCPPPSLRCIAPTCLEIDLSTGKWTGKGY